jgi:hypothetical protein
MARAAGGSRRAWRARTAAALLAALAIAGTVPKARAGDAVFNPGSAAAIQIKEVVELAIAQPAQSAVSYLGTVPLKVQLVFGTQPGRVIFAFERLQDSGWHALGTLETGWELVPTLVPGSFLQASGRYRVRAAPGGSQARRVVTPAEYHWSAWREFSFQAGNTVPVGTVKAPAAKVSGGALQP